MTPIQCRMARAALDMEIADLAASAKVPADKVAAFEHGKPLGRKTVGLLQGALEAAGCVFTKDDNERTVGVLVRKSPATIEQLDSRIARLETSASRLPQDAKPSPTQGMRLLERGRKQNAAVALRNRREKMLKKRQA